MGWPRQGSKKKKRVKMHERCFFLFPFTDLNDPQNKNGLIFSRLINKERRIPLKQNKIKNTYYLQVVLFK